jgi:hypothetical protein
MVRRLEKKRIVFLRARSRRCGGSKTEPTWGDKEGWHSFVGWLQSSEFGIAHCTRRGESESDRNPAGLVWPASSVVPVGMGCLLEFSSFVWPTASASGGGEGGSRCECSGSQ